MDKGENKKSKYEIVDDYLLKVKMMFGPTLLLIIAFVDISNKMIYFLSVFLFLLIVIQTFLNYKIYNRLIKSFIIELFIVTITICIIIFYLT
ncbi:hypothetical protein [Oceanobacillus manasiensis]|uniref:hypothetical protein n=1 Tax=Oceanobacillus manasiensis TaxID=586413 RepID=UPI0005A70374|nr:hypothetical protein [Oceanobacillus manasiensis]